MTITFFRGMTWISISFWVHFLIWARRAHNKISVASEGGSTSSRSLFLKLCFNVTDDNENWCAGWHRHFARFDVFGFLIWGFWARWQRATRALFSHFRVVVAIFCYNMHFHVFWRLGKIFLRGIMAVSALQADDTSSSTMFLMLRFNATDDNENRCAG